MAKTYFTGSGYLDGIPVKIGEKFKPPVRITLPLNYQHRNPTDVLNDDYDFALERRILQVAEQKRKMKELKERVKDEQVASRIEQFTRLGNGKCSDSSEGSPTGSGNITSSADSSECAQTDSPKQQSDSTIFPHFKPKNMLMPETANQTRPETPPQPPQNAIKLEDFESESSPFDSVELKTLNDMEELKNVLQSIAPSETNGISSPQQYQYDQTNFSTCQPYQQYHPGSKSSYYDRLPTYSTYSMQWNLPENVYRQMPQTNGTYCYSDTYSAMPQTELVVSNLRAARSTPDLTSELGGVSKPIKPSSHLPRPNSVGSVQSFGSDLTGADDYEQLDESGKTLARQMSDMGFPRPRVVRAILRLGVDDKKIVDHLCCVQSMVESGFDAERAESALFLHDQDQKRAQIYLQLSKQFMDLGFAETAIEEALRLHDNDRDKALDYLIS